MADNFAQTLKAQVDIIKVLGEYVRLKKTGAQNYTGLCPFHKEKSPSFSVNAARGFFYCFGCHEKGDVFTFVMKLENVSFPEAVRTVAGKVGVAMPKREFGSAEEAREAGLRGRLIDIHEAATQYFEAQLKSPEAARAREYLTGRGLTADTIAKFRIGYAPDDFNDMRDRLRGHFAEEVLRASGLFSSKEQADGSGGPMYARFRKRITFPIANEQGKVIAFTARALDSDEKSGPKYMNSPETPLYSKGHVLFNLDKAKADMRTLDFALLVEGQMDCISVYMAGIRNVVATSGTAFTEVQAGLLSRFAQNVIVNFDPDSAGTNAGNKSISLLKDILGPLMYGQFNIKVLRLEGGLDPDRFIRERGIMAYKGALRGAQRYSDYLIEQAREQFGTRTPEAKVKAMNFLLPFMRQMSQRIYRDEFVDDAAQKLGIDSAVMREELKQAAAQRKGDLSLNQSVKLEEYEITLLRILCSPGANPARARAVNELTENMSHYEGLASAHVIERLINAPCPDNPLDVASDATDQALLATALDVPIVPTLGTPLMRETPSDTEQVEEVLRALRNRWRARRLQELRASVIEANRRGDQSMEMQLTLEIRQIDQAQRLH